MSQLKPKLIKREMVALEALRQGMAVIKKGHQVFGLHTDGSKELISKSHDSKDIWSDALLVLKSRVGSTNKKAEQNSDTTENGVKNSTKLKIYSDGGSRGNPGPSASGYVILTADESHILEQGGRYLGVTTNNQAEYQAVKQALEAAAKFNPQEINFFIDSLLVVNQLNGVYKVKNKELWPVHQAIREMAKKYNKITFNHVYREDNTLADEQVNIILDEEADLRKS